MRKKSAIFVNCILILVFFLSAKTVFAHHQRQILGDSSVSATPQIPPTVEGPGLILPDSPLFFLDKIKQSIRLFFAFTPEAKAKVHAAIAGERLAELRFMLAKNHEGGIKVALEGVAENTQKSTEDLNNAKLSGRNVSTLAKSINITIKEKQEALDALEHQAKGELKARVGVSREILKVAKLEVEDALPEQELENEIHDELENEIENEVEDASESAKKVEHLVERLQEEASKSATKALRRREEAIKKAIGEKNKELEKFQQRLRKEEEEKQKELLKAQEKAGIHALGAIIKYQEAAQKFKEAQQKVDEIKSMSTETSSNPPESGSSSSSGSGDSKSKSSDRGAHDSGSGGGDSGKSGGE